MFSFHQYPKNDHEAQTPQGEDTQVSKRRGRGGRPSLSESERRSRRIGVPVNEEEESLIGQRAASQHMAKALFLRSLGMGRRLPRPIPAINYRAYRRLGRLAANLNRIVLLINAGKRVGLSQEFAQLLLDELQAIRQSLLMGEQDDRQDIEG